jgi:ferrous iron transport protein B
MVEKLLKSDAISPRALGLLLLTGDSGAENFVAANFGAGMMEQLKDLAAEYNIKEQVPLNIVLTNLYNQQAEKIAGQVQQIETPTKNPFIMTFGDLCTQLSTGIPIALAVVSMLYLFVGSFGATFLVDTINGTLFQGFLIPWTEKLVEPIPSAFLRDMIVDPDFGLLPTGVFLALGLVLPVLFCFYIVFGVLEDSGYMPRLSILLDKVFKKIGLNGKGVIPLVMGFSCITMAILTTRMLDTKKEKNIATLLLLLGIPCAPLLAVMFIILGKMPLSATLTIFGVLLLQVFTVGFCADKIFKGRQAALLIEIPPMRLPKPFQVLKMAALKTYFFMKEAVPVFMLASLVVFLVERMGGLAVLERIAKPVISGYMGLPEKSVQVFIKTIIRRESGATEIQHLSSVYDNVQLVVNLLVMTFLSPCINAAIVVFKERGVKTAIIMMGAVMIYAVVFGGIINHILRFLGITFS